ncbi:hypothetical protein [Cupriavidus pampae]|uniref:Uncharacterized protein n=1 Tax=Cupriavidus pampae TaxID=659251 RepID=A0ABN7ZD90_9BURK|nr:hypothetical protein [Cupriavidus pampae]CAG9183943.1 hypothetical protein LMG32289_05468 [Cupriavidus pampae]
MLQIMGVAAVLVAVMVMLRRRRATRGRIAREGYPLGALIDDVERAGKLAEVGGMDVLVQRVLLAEDQQAEVAKVRAALGVPAAHRRARASSHPA